MFPHSGALILAVLLSLSGCATFGTPPVQPGEPENQVIGKLGQPTARYQDGGDQLLEYATGPWGQYTYMARIGADKRLISYEQVLTTQKFSTLTVNKSTREDVLRTIGRPNQTSYLGLRDLEVWSYGYREGGVWDSAMHVHFDRSGVVRELMNGPDRRRTERGGWLLGL